MDLHLVNFPQENNPIGKAEHILIKRIAWNDQNGEIKAEVERLTDRTSAENDPVDLGIDPFSP